jgi:hypothetical protein
MVLETDPYGNFLTQGYEFLSAATGRASAICGCRTGMWNGERILPEGLREYARTSAPAWVADGG